MDKRRDNGPGSLAKQQNHGTQIPTGAALVVLSLGLLIYHSGWILEMVSGPQEVKAQELGQVKTPDELEKQWIKLQFEEFQETKILSAEESDNPSSRFILVNTSPDWLITEVPIDFEGKTANGFVEVWQTPFKRGAIQRIKEKFPDHDFIPFQLDADYGHRADFYSFVVTALIFLGGGIFLIYRGWKESGARKREPSNPYTTHGQR